jgi:CheY-like chemotaxis protein
MAKGGRPGERRCINPARRDLALLRNLQDQGILVVEDEFLQALEICAQLKDAGALSIGPVGTCEDAISLIKTNSRIDFAVLDVSLGGDLSYPVADLLTEMNIPFVFTTGHTPDMIPRRFNHVQFCSKPVDFESFLGLISERFISQDGSPRDRSRARLRPQRAEPDTPARPNPP